METDYQIQEDGIDQLTLRTPFGELKDHFGEFASALAHQVRNPLSNIKLAGEVVISIIGNIDQKIFLNIIINDIKIMTTKKGQLKITKKLTGDRFVREIEDNNCATSNKNLRNISKLYFTSEPGDWGFDWSPPFDILQSNHVRVNGESEEGKENIFLSFINHNQ